MSKELVLRCEECDEILNYRKNELWNPYDSLVVEPCEKCIGEKEEEIENKDTEINFLEDKIGELDSLQEQLDQLNSEYQELKDRLDMRNML